MGAAAVLPRGVSIVRGMADSGRIQHRTGLGRGGSALFSACAVVAMALLLGGCAMGFNPRRVPDAVQIPAEGISVPIDVAHNLAFVQASVNGSEPLWFMIDTGAFSVIIDDDAAVAAGMKRDLRFGTHSTSAGDHFGRMDLGRFDSFQIGGAAFGGFEGLIADLSHLAETVEHPFDGVIGIPLMYSSVWTIDYARKQLRLARAMPELADDPAAIPFMYSGDTPAIEIQIGHTTLSAEIDTGSTGGLDLDDADAKRVPLQDGPRISTKHKTLTGEVWEQWVRLEATLRIGPLTFERPMANLSRDTRFGGEVFDGCAFTIDCAQQLVRIERVE